MLLIVLSRFVSVLDKACVAKDLDFEINLFFIFSLIQKYKLKRNSKDEIFNITFNHLNHLALTKGGAQA